MAPRASAYLDLTWPSTVGSCGSDGKLVSYQNSSPVSACVYRGAPELAMRQVLEEEGRDNAGKLAEIELQPGQAWQPWRLQQTRNLDEMCYTHICTYAYTYKHVSIYIHAHICACL